MSFFNKIKQSKLIKNSLIIFVGTMIINIGNYGFHLIMSRMLDIKTFGEFEALISLMYIISVPSATLVTMITKYTSEFKSIDDNEKIKLLFSTFTKVLFFWSLVLFLIFSLLSPVIASFLKLSSFWPVIILGTVMLFSFFLSIVKGLLTGLQKFFTLSWTGVMTVFLKLFLAFIFVKVSFGLNGIMGAVSLSVFLGYFISLFPIKKYLSLKKGSLIEIKEMFFYLLPTFIILLCINLYYSLDVILVKYFFEPELAGKYGAISIIGRVIFFITGAIISVMFPMIIEARKHGRNFHHFLRKSGLLVLLISGSALFIYFLFPEFVIMLLVGSKYYSIAPYIGWFGLAMLLFSFINMFSSYFLSVDKFRSLYVFVLGVVLQVSLLSFFHESLFQVVLMMNVSMGGILLGLIVYYFLTKKNDKFKSDIL